MIVSSLVNIYVLDAFISLTINWGNSLAFNQFVHLQYNIYSINCGKLLDPTLDDGKIQHMANCQKNCKDLNEAISI